MSSIAELKTKYGVSKKPKLAINAAIRAEIPGGAKVLDLTYKLSCQLPKLRNGKREVAQNILNELLMVSDEMKNFIAEKYHFESAETQEAEIRRPGRPALPKEKRRNQQITVRLSPEELARITEPGHRKAVGELVRELVLKASQVGNR